MGLLGGAAFFETVLARDARFGVLEGGMDGLCGLYSIHPFLMCISLIYSRASE
jgi:hypothetical protein